jgi:hypothetical protein
MNVLVTGIMALRFRTDTTKDTIIAVDEAGAIMRTPSLAMFLLRTLTQGRSYRIALWLATQQTVDLVKAGVSDEFKTNMAINIVLGDNMKRDTVALVADYFRLDTDAVDKLMSCSVGEGLLMIRDQMMHVRFKPTDHELNVIKGCTTSTGTGTEKPSNGSELDSRVAPLALEHGVYFEDWVAGGGNGNGNTPQILQDNEYVMKKVQRVVSRGTVVVWIKSELLNYDGETTTILNQSVDHYCTVVQLGGHLAMRGFDVVINHHSDADVLVKSSRGMVAFEYERPGTHNPSELLKKKQFAENHHSMVFFVCNSDNEESIKEVVGADCVVRRGVQLEALLKTIKP